MEIAAHKWRKNRTIGSEKEGREQPFVSANEKKLIRAVHKIKPSSEGFSRLEARVIIRNGNAIVGRSSISIQVADRR